VSNTLYAKSPLERFIADITATTKFQHVLGDYEAARKVSQRPPVLWRHPEGRAIIELVPITDRRPEIDAFKTAEETIEMVVVAQDYFAALWTMTEIWRLGFDARTREAEDLGRSYRDDITYGRVRRGREGEFRGVPAGSFVLVDLVTIRWLVPRQEPLFATPESVDVSGIMKDGDTVVETI